MSISVVMMGRDEESLCADRALLKNRGIRVYICSRPKDLHALIAEVRPDIVFLNYPDADEQERKWYIDLRASVPKRIPMLFTLAEDEAYAVRSWRDDGRWHSFLSDNIIDAVRWACAQSAGTGKSPWPVASRMTPTIWLRGRMGLPASA